MSKVEVVQNNDASNAFMGTNPTSFTPMFFLFESPSRQMLNAWLFAAVTVLSTAISDKTLAQSLDVNWPGDVLDALCDQSIDAVAGQPELAVENGCIEVEMTYEDELLAPPCAQETWVDRHWLAVGCGDTLMYVQRIRLRDVVSPVVVFDDTYTGHFCAGTLDWLPNLQDNCDGSLSGGVSTSDTLTLCEGAFSFVVSLEVADDCGNVLDTNYTVVLHEACDAIVYPVISGCTDSTATNYEVEATCDSGVCTYANEFCGEGTYFEPNAGVCLPLSTCADPWEFCGPFTVWDDQLERCVPEVISAACYFDINSSGVVDIADLLGFLGVYGTSCVASLNEE